MVGPYKTRKMFYTGEFVGAMSSTGSVRWRRWCPPTNCRPLATRDVIATKCPIGLRLAKESLNRVEDLGLKDGYRPEQDYTGESPGASNSAEARRSYREARPRMDLDLRPGKLRHRTAVTARR